MDLNGHMVDRGGGIGNKKGGGSSSNPTVSNPPANPSNSGKKPSYTPSGAYTSDGFDGGSSYHYAPPPPDPRQYYRSLVIRPYVVNNSGYYYTYNELTKKKTIKDEIYSNSNSSILDKVTVLLPDSACAMIANNVPS